MVTPINNSAPGAYDYRNMNPGQGGLPALKDYLNNGGAVSPEAFGYYMPEYRGTTDANGNMLSNFQYNPQQVNYGGMQSYDAYKKFALGTGPSDMYKTQSGLIDQQTNASMDQMRQETARGVAAGQSNLAATGGLDSGARERLAQSGTRNRLDASQDVYRSASMAKGQAGVADAQMRFGALQGLTGMDTNAALVNTQMTNQGQMFNIGNQINDTRMGNLYDLEGWGKLGDIWGSSEIARSMGGGGGGGSPVGRGAYDPTGAHPQFGSHPVNGGAPRPAYSTGSQGGAPQGVGNDGRKWWDYKGWDAGGWAANAGGGGGGGGWTPKISMGGGGGGPSSW